jgi:hypothetical protein
MKWTQEIGCGEKAVIYKYSMRQKKDTMEDVEIEYSLNSSFVPASVGLVHLTNEWTVGGVPW